MRRRSIIAGLACSLALAACGSGARQDASEPSGNFPVQASAQWTNSQSLAQHTQLQITATNTGSKTIPDVAVTICNVTCNPSPSGLANGEGTSVQAFADKLNMPGLASDSRPVWIVDQAPGRCEYSCRQGGPGGAATAYSNTWAMGALAPGKSVTFDWRLTAVASGTHVVYWEVAAGLNGKAKAVTSSGSRPYGTFTVNVSHKPAQAYVDNNGKVVTTP